VHGEQGEPEHLCADRYVASVDLKRACAFKQRSPARPFSLETGQHDGIPSVGKEVAQVMQDASACRHAGGRDNDRRQFMLVDRLRLLDRACLYQVAGIERIAVALEIGSYVGCTLGKGHPVEREGG